MAVCPNCGRQALRTKDWACQWCGYPLISRAYKVIDKTFKELQEERNRASMTVDADMDLEPEEEAEYKIDEAEAPAPPDLLPEPELNQRQIPLPEQKPKFRFFRKPESTPRPRPETRREPEPPRPPVGKPAPQPDLPVQRQTFPEQAVRRPEIKQEPPITPKQETRPEPEPVRKTEPAPVMQNNPETVISPQIPVELKPVALPPSIASTPAPAPTPVIKPEIVVGPQQAHVSSVKLEDINDGVEITADDLDALFRADKSAANLKLNGKTIVLKGVVEKVFIREHLDIRYIVVTGKKRLAWSSRCTFNKEDSIKASRLSENAEVSVRGKYDGYGKNVIFKDCQVI